MKTLAQRFKSLSKSRREEILLHFLSDRERLVVLYKGFGQKELSYEEIGREMRKTREVVRGIHEYAISKLEYLVTFLEKKKYLPECYQPTYA